MRTRYCGCNMLLIVAFRFVSVMVTIRFVSFMLEAALVICCLFFQKLFKLNILMEETICKSCILAFMNATRTFCMINIVSN